MTVTLAHIWRHPVKSHGREELSEVALIEGQTMPWDRTWAVAHEGARTDGTEWARCANFSRGAKAPQLMAIDCKLDETSEALTLSHPNRETVTLHPERDAPQFMDWVRPLMPENRAQSTHVVRVEGRGMTDTPFPSLSIANIATHAAVEAQLDTKLSMQRWRANLWLDGLEAWDEFNWVGKTLRIGEVEFSIEERITRCLATTVNPETGERDSDTLGALKTWGHQDFGVYGVVKKSGAIRTGDKAQII
ncbi:MOSC N-terminal beta barrel domain-containing protein [uncultured Litoreibacter sp.]|uniref:MOSC domain-containing protein n=1 Tax=uncultured Litoreibacter sp. TaxID=1392394 RepID=UPI0026140B84|nr:MOSC N-terminal beta barrel domain-containing protein [uncultured Litoreibacter sp.]